MLRKDGTRVPVLVAVAMLDHPDCIAVVLDLSERKRAEAALRRMEEQLRHAQKMEAIGSLAGGVAHDFNNLLSVILSYVAIIGDTLPRGDPMAESLDEIRLAGERAAALTHQLLGFRRPQLLQPQSVNLNEVVVRTDNMLRRLIGEDIELVKV